MELRHLRSFVTVAETLHFGEAAAELHVAQPALSRTIRQLEREVGATLLTRTTRRVELTAAGTEYLERVRQALAALEEAAVRARQTGEGLLGTLRLGVTGSASYGVLPQVARAMAARMPGVQLQVETELLTPVQEEALLQGRLDAGLLRPPVSAEELACQVLVSEPLVLAVPATHRLGGAAAAALRELREDVFVLYAAATGSVVHGVVERACQDAGFVPRRGHEVKDTSTLLALVAAGLGIGLVPASARALALPGVRFVPVQDSPTVDLALAWRRERTPPAVERLVALLADLDLSTTDGGVVPTDLTDDPTDGPTDGPTLPVDLTTEKE